MISWYSGYNLSFSIGTDGDIKLFDTQPRRPFGMGTGTKKQTFVLKFSKILLTKTNVCSIIALVKTNIKDLFSKSVGRDMGRVFHINIK